MGVIVKMNGSSLAILVTMILVIITMKMHCTAAISGTRKSNSSTSAPSCNGPDDEECLVIIDMDMELLMESEINLRLLAPSIEIPKPVTGNTGNAGKPSANCGRGNAAASCTPDSNGNVRPCEAIYGCRQGS
uniref:Rapid ALkalinization Factor n=1 Tax=Davidia involucrata TaxID=16924 RepID=A0A5B7A2Y9_DAVIN